MTEPTKTDEQFKFLAIKNWPKYQPDKKLRKKSARLPFIKDYTARLNDLDWTKLRMYERALLEQLGLFCATVPSRLVYNDITYIVRALHILPTDAPHVRHGLSTLIARGFLIPTNNEEYYVSKKQIFDEILPEIREERVESESGDGGCLNDDEPSGKQKTFKAAANGRVGFDIPGEEL